MRYILSLLLFFWSFEAEAQAPASIPADGKIEWSAEEQPRGATYQSNNVIVTFRPELDAESPELILPVVTIRFAGLPPVTLRGQATSPFFKHQANVGRWTREGAPFVLFQSFTGGAHCCTTMTVAYPSDGQARVVDLGAWDGDYMDTPRDIDGDGSVDFVNYDNSFLYAFTYYAASFAPPLVRNVVNGAVEEVSDRPGFRSLFEEAARAARSHCITLEADRNGACAAFVASAARLDRFNEAWVEMLQRHNPESDWPLTRCRVPETSTGCPAGQSFEESYPRALHRLLVDRGYIARVP